MGKSKYHRSLGFDFKAPAQRNFILLEFVLLMFTMLYLLYLIFATVEGVAADMSVSNSAELRTVVNRIHLLLLVRISVLFLIVFVMNVIVGFFFLHRLTGPLVRIKAVLNRIAAGDVPEGKVVLRKGDFPTDLSDALSRALERIRRWRRSR